MSKKCASQTHNSEYIKLAKCQPPNLAFNLVKRNGREPHAYAKCFARIFETLIKAICMHVTFQCVVRLRLSALTVFTVYQLTPTLR